MCMLVTSSVSIFHYLLESLCGIFAKLPTMNINFVENMSSVKASNIILITINSINKTVYC